MNDPFHDCTPKRPAVEADRVYFWPTELPAEFTQRSVFYPFHDQIWGGRAKQRLPTVEIGGIEVIMVQDLDDACDGGGLMRYEVRCLRLQAQGSLVFLA